jgi:hypothetical protein
VLELNNIIANLELMPLRMNERKNPRRAASARFGAEAL